MKLGCLDLTPPTPQDGRDPIDDLLQNLQIYLFVVALVPKLALDVQIFHVMVTAHLVTSFVSNDCGQRSHSDTSRKQENCRVIQKVIVHFHDDPGEIQGV